MDNTISVSIIMPVYNEEKYIDGSLNSIMKQNYSNICEILILDGLSVDLTRSKVQAYMETDKRIKLVDNDDKTPAHALNKGITMANGEVIIRVDAHALYDEDYVLQCINTLISLKEEKVVNVGGATRFVTSQAYIENSIIMLHESKFGIGVAKFRDKNYEGFVDTVWNGAFYKWVFDEVGLYNVNMNRSEDNDMNNRILEKGYKIYQSKSIISYYFPRTTLNKVIKQNSENGKAIGKALISNRSIIRLRHLIPFIFTTSIIILGILSVPFTLFRYLLCADLISYFLVDLFESTRISLSKGLKYFPVMFSLFFVLHISYGLGTIKGIIQG